MKIEIDTQRDSPEEIRKAVRLLQSLLSEHSYTNEPSGVRNIFDDSPVSGTSSEQPPSQPAGGLLGIFDNPQQSTVSKKSDDSNSGDVPPVVEYY